MSRHATKKHTQASSFSRIKLSNIYFIFALTLIIALNIFMITRVFVLQTTIETLSESISKIPELARPLVIPEEGTR